MWRHIWVCFRLSAHEDINLLTRVNYLSHQCKGVQYHDLGLNLFYFILDYERINGDIFATNKISWSKIQINKNITKFFTLKMIKISAVTHNFKKVEILPQYRWHSAYNLFLVLLIEIVDVIQYIECFSWLSLYMHYNIWLIKYWIFPILIVI